MMNEGFPHDMPDIATQQHEEWMASARLIMDNAAAKDIPVTFDEMYRYVAVVGKTTVLPLTPFEAGGHPTDAISHLDSADYFYLVEALDVIGTHGDIDSSATAVALAADMYTTVVFAPNVSQKMTTLRTIFGIDPQSYLSVTDQLVNHYANPGSSEEDRRIMSASVNARRRAPELQPIG